MKNKAHESRAAANAGDPESRVLDAMEDIPEGFALYDAQDRLISCNHRYRELFFPGNEHFVAPGMRFEELVRHHALATSREDVAGDREGWIRRRVERHRDCGEPFEHRLPDGRWILSAEHRTLTGGVVCIHTDITRFKRAEIELENAHQRLTYHVENSPLAVVEWDREFRLQRWSPQAERMFGWSAAELLGRKPTEWRFVPGEDAEQVSALMSELLDGSAPRNVSRHRNYTRDGSLLLCEWYNSALRDEAGNLVSILSLVQDITEAHRLAEQLSYQATHDALTGLINRRAFEQRLQQVLDDARDDRSVHTMCYMDLDRFKLINDSCGHMAGDELLRQLGALLPRKVRKRDTLARLGGDEFGVLMEHCTLKQARRAANEIRNAIEDFRFAWEGRTYSVGVSIGLAPVTRTSKSITTVMGAADSACYLAKEHGPNRIHVYRRDDAELSRRHGEMQWVTRIQEALDNDRFKLVFQPIVPLTPDAGSGDHYELLLRMEDEFGHFVSPGAFLPAAERYYLSHKLDRWVVNAAIDWMARHPQHLAGLYMCSINLSGRSLGDEEVLEFIIQRLDRTEVPPEKICFEITETAAITNLGVASRFIRVLREWGCSFALDDFGSGLSSFAYLKNLDVDFIKIDGVFVRHIAENPIDLAMVKSINDIAHVMGKQTVAEWVEDDEVLGKLREIGVDYAQGFGIGRPKLLDTMKHLRVVK